MTQTPSKPARPRRASVGDEEQKAWAGFYRRVGDPALAMEILRQLDADADMKRAHLALYLLCKEGLRRHKARQARHQRIGHGVRLLCGMLLLAPLHALRQLLQRSGDVLVACLPDIVREPARPRVQQLSRDAEFAQATSAFDEAFDGKAATPAAAPSERPGAGAQAA